MEEIYKPNKIKISGYFILCFLLLILGVVVILFLPPGGWNSFIGGMIMIILFGLGSVFTLGNIIYGSYLKLNEEGFELKFSFKKNFTKWKDVNRFSVSIIGRKKFVSYEYSNSYRKQEGAREFAKMISGTEAILPDNFGKKTEELADIMNSWKKKFG
jgi:hypothetical protein